MGEKDVDRPGRTAEDRQDRITHYAAAPLKPRPDGGKSGLPLVGAATEYGKDEFQVFNKHEQVGEPKKPDKNQNQNLPMIEEQNTNAAAQGLPLVGIESSNTHRKEPRRKVPQLTQLQDHLVLESKRNFRIILRLENALSLQSLYPLDNGAVATRYPTNDFRALPGILA